MKKGCSLIQHPFFSNSMKSANRFFDIFRKKLAEWEGRPHSPVGKLAVGKDGEGKGREKRKETYQKSRKMEKSNEFGQSGIPWTVSHSGEKKNEKGGGGGASGKKWLMKGKWLVPSQIFLKILKKQFALFEKFEEKGC